MLDYCIPEPRRNILVCHNFLGHAVDVTDTLLHWTVDVLFAFGHNDVLNAVSKQEVVKLFAADLTSEVREEGLGVAADTRDELNICLLNPDLLVVRDKHLGVSLVANKQDVVSVTTSRRNTSRATDVEVCDLPRLEESQRDLVGNTLWPDCDDVTWWSGKSGTPSVCFEKLGR